MRGVRRTLAALLLILPIACGGNKQSRPTGDPDTIRRDQVLAGTYSTAYDVVRALHPNWLIRRNPTSSKDLSPIWVYVDGSRYGDLGWLRNVPAGSIGSIRRINAGAATTRWGSGHTEGVLYITTYLPSSSDFTAN